MSFLARAEALDRRLEQNIDAINRRMRTLDEQIRVVDHLLAGLDGGIPAPRTQEEDNESDWDHYSITDSSVDDDDMMSVMTLEYHTGADNVYFSDEEGYISDDETIVGDWFDPFKTPEQDGRIIIPANLEEGLEMLN